LDWFKVWKGLPKKGFPFLGPNFGEGSGLFLVTKFIKEGARGIPNNYSLGLLVRNRGD